MNRSTEADFDQRIADWLEDIPRAKTRKSRFTLLVA